MAASGTQSLPTLGFFTVIEDAEAGIVGGLLVLNAAGRPLEFHCTAPLKPNRAQEILYGPTLRPFLYGEQIGTVLASKTKSDTLFLCTDVEPAMCLRDSINTPLLLLLPSEAPRGEVAEESGKQRVLRFDREHSANSPAFLRLAEFTLGRHQVAVLKDHESDKALVQERWRPYSHLDLLEPFDRIREALDEARRGASK